MITPPYTQYKPNTGDSSALTHYPNNTPSHYIIPFPMLIIAPGLPYDEVVKEPTEKSQKRKDVNKK